MAVNQGRAPAVYQIVGYKNTGKTTLICQLISHLTKRGYRIGTVKHDGHDFDIDHPHTDSWKHRKAGATISAITSAQRTAWIREQAMQLDELVATMLDVDFVLVEGFKQAPYPKLVLLRSEADFALVAQLDHVEACSYWPEVSERIDMFTHPSSMPFFPLADDAAIASHIIQVLQRG